MKTEVLLWSAQNSISAEFGHSRGYFLFIIYSKISHSLETYCFSTLLGYILPLVESFANGLAKLHVFASHPTRRGPRFAADFVVTRSDSCQTSQRKDHNTSVLWSKLLWT